jgi:regulatory protein
MPRSPSPPPRDGIARPPPPRHTSRVVSPGERLVDPETRLQHARDLAWAALNRREHTVAELRRVLERKRVEPSEIVTVLEELTAGGWVDDAAYARRFAEDRRALDGWGSERIARRLQAVGVEREHIEAAVGVRADGDEREAALELLRRRFPDPPADPRERNRALGLLARRGYELELAYDVLRRYCGAGEFD